MEPCEGATSRSTSKRFQVPLKRLGLTFFRAMNLRGGRKTPQSSLFFSVFCCCFSNAPSSQSQSDVSENFNPAGDDFPVTLSQALLCLDNPQIPSCQVSFPITEEIILAKHRCENVLQQPCVTRSTQMLFMGYDAESLRTIDLCKDSYSPEMTPRIGDRS